MSEWTPPKDGTPCWVEIPASDVPRAKAFYAKAFDWDFKSNPAGSSHKDEDLAMFGYPDEKLKSLGGGIVKYDKDKMTMKKGGVTVFLYVNDIEAKLKQIIEAGGKAIGQIYSEGDTGWIQNFEDTEGNFCGLYSLKKE